MIQIQGYTLKKNHVQNFLMPSALREWQEPTYLSSCGFRASFSANPPDQTEKLLPHTITLNLPALKNMQMHYY